MFAPNSIKTLMSIKNYNQIDQGKDQSGKNPLSPVKGGDKSNSKPIEDSKNSEFSPKNSRDMSEKVINTRVLLKEIDCKLDDLKKWKRRQKRELERRLLENKSLAMDSDEKEKYQLEDDSYDKYIQKLEEMMELYKKDLDEARRQARNVDSNSHTIMSEIGNQLSEREQRIAELSNQLSIYENQKSFKDYEKELNFIGDIQSLKGSLENWRKEHSLAAIKRRGAEKAFDLKENIMESENPESIKDFIKKEKEEISKEQKYDFKNDLDDIENELQELEEMLNSK